MQEENSSLATGTTTENQNQTQAPEQIIEKNPEAGAQKPPEKPTDQTYDAEWWKKDKRFGKAWKSEADFPKLYRDLDQILESKYKPSHQQLEGLKNKFKDAGIEVDKLDDYIKEYQGFKDPNNPDTVRSKYFSQWLENPNYNEKVTKFFQDLETAELERQYPNMTAEARAKMIELEQKVNKFDEMTKQQEQEKLVSNYRNEINSNIKEIEKIAKENGFEFTDEIKKQFLEECSKNAVLPRYMVNEFKTKFYEALEKGHEDKLKSKLLEDMNKKNKATIPLTKSVSVVQEKKEGFEGRLKKLFKT